MRNSVCVAGCGWLWVGDWVCGHGQQPVYVAGCQWLGMWLGVCGKQHVLVAGCGWPWVGDWACGCAQQHACLPGYGDCGWVGGGVSMSNSMCVSGWLWVTVGGWLGMWATTCVWVDEWAWVSGSGWLGVWVVTILWMGGWLGVGGCLGVGGWLDVWVWATPCVWLCGWMAGCVCATACVWVTGCGWLCGWLRVNKLVTVGESGCGEWMWVTRCVGGDNIVAGWVTGCGHQHTLSQTNPYTRTHATHTQSPTHTYCICQMTSTHLVPQTGQSYCLPLVLPLTPSPIVIHTWWMTPTPSSSLTQMHPLSPTHKPIMGTYHGGSISFLVWNLQMHVLRGIEVEGMTNDWIKAKLSDLIF